MSFEFHPDQLLELLKNYPVLIVLLCGQLGGISFTQVVKKNYLDWSRRPDTPVRVPDGRYRASVRTLSCFSTFGFTLILWSFQIPVHDNGVHIIGAAIAGFTSPWVYTAVHAAVAWKFPEFAAKWGDVGRDDS